MGFILILLNSACGIVNWHSIEQVPAEPFAYIRDGVFVSGNYVRSAKVIQIDDITYEGSKTPLLEIGLGKRRVKILCGEAKGDFDTKQFTGQEKILEFEAQIQRTYRVGCLPHTHWWIEDLDNQKIVAGEKAI